MPGIVRAVLLTENVADYKQTKVTSHYITSERQDYFRVVCTSYTCLHYTQTFSFISKPFAQCPTYLLYIQTTLFQSHLLHAWHVYFTHRLLYFSRLLNSLYVYITYDRLIQSRLLNQCQTCLHYKQTTIFQSHLFNSRISKLHKTDTFIQSRLLNGS